MGLRENFRKVTDEHHDRASDLGRLFMEGSISELQYRAGVDYAKTILDYLKTIDAPDPYGADLSDFSDAQCESRKAEMARARAKLNRAGHRSASVVDRVTVYGEPMAPGELPLLSAGLLSLTD